MNDFMLQVTFPELLITKWVTNEKKHINNIQHFTVHKPRRTELHSWGIQHASSVKEDTETAAP